MLPHLRHDLRSRVFRQYPRIRFIELAPPGVIDVHSKAPLEDLVDCPRVYHGGVTRLPRARDVRVGLPGDSICNEVLNERDLRMDGDGLWS